MTRKLAVLNVHLSPGMTNAITGVISAAGDSTPMLVFAGNTPSYHHAREAHQAIRFHADASQGDIYKPFSKRVWRVDDAKLLVDVIPRALNLAQTGRPGVVFIDVPMDVFIALSMTEPPAGSTAEKTPSLEYEPQEETVKSARAVAAQITSTAAVRARSAAIETTAATRPIRRTRGSVVKSPSLRSMRLVLKLSRPSGTARTAARRRPGIFISCYDIKIQSV